MRSASMFDTSTPHLFNVDMSCIFTVAARRLASRQFTAASGTPAWA